MSVTHFYKVFLPGTQTRSPRRIERGQGLIEAVIVIPILLVMLAAIVDLAIMYVTAQTIQHTSREGARFAVKLENLEADDVRVSNFVDTLIPGSNLYSSFLNSTDVAFTSCGSSDQVTVSISGEYHFLALNMIGLNSVPLTMSTSMRYEMCG